MEELLLSATECTGAEGVRQTEMHTAEPFVPEPSGCEVEVAVGKLKSCKLPGVEQVPAELIQGGGETLYAGIHVLTKLILNQEELLHQWKRVGCCTCPQKGR
jgi:hypothetical protein